MDKEDEKYKKFNCKICFDLAMEPVITPCGHMYCWQCIYKWAQTKNPLKCPYCSNVFELDKVVTVFAGEEKEGKKRDIPKRPENTRNDTPPPQAQNQFQFGLGFGLPFMMFQLQPNQGGLFYFFIGLFLLNFVGVPNLSRLTQSLGSSSQMQVAIVMMLCFVGLHFLTKKVFNR